MSLLLTRHHCSGENWLLYTKMKIVLLALLTASQKVISNQNITWSHSFLTNKRWTRSFTSLLRRSFSTWWAQQNQMSLNSWSWSISPWIYSISSWPAQWLAPIWHPSTRSESWPSHTSLHSPSSRRAVNSSNSVSSSEYCVGYGHSLTSSSTSMITWISLSHYSRFTRPKMSNNFSSSLVSKSSSCSTS